MILEHRLDPHTDCHSLLPCRVRTDTLSNRTWIEYCPQHSRWNGELGQNSQAETLDITHAACYTMGREGSVKR